MRSLGRGVAALATAAVVTIGALVTVGAGPATADPAPDGEYGTAGSARLRAPCGRAGHAEVGPGGTAYVLDYCSAHDRIKLRALPEPGTAPWTAALRAPALVRKSVQHRPDEHWKVAWGPRGSAYVVVPVPTVAGNGRETMHFFVGHVGPGGSPDRSYGRDAVARVRLPGTLAGEDFDASVDSRGRVVIATGGDRTSVTRLTATGRRDRSFSGDGTARPRCGDWRWGGIDPAGRPLLACDTQYRRHRMHDSVDYLRLTESGAPDPQFGQLGRRRVKNSTVEGRQQAFLVDDRGGLTFVVAHQSRAGSGSTWFDLERLTAQGRRSKGFAQHTERVEPPAGHHGLVVDRSSDLQGHVAVTWSGKSRERLTAFTSDGSRWQAAGPDGTLALAPYETAKTSSYATSTGLFFVDEPHHAAARIDKYVVEPTD